MLQKLNLLSTDWSLGINVTITGLVVVFGMLVLLVIVLYIFGLFFDKTPKKKKPIKEENKPSSMPIAASTPAKAENNGLSDEIVAVIAATVASMYDGSAIKPVIRRISKADKKARPAWTAAGVFENTRSF